MVKNKIKAESNIISEQSKIQNKAKRKNDIEIKFFIYCGYFVEIFFKTKGRM